MITKIKTAPTVEPVSLTEMKEFLKLSADSLADNLTESQSIVPGAHVVAATYTLVGTGVDVLGYSAVVVLDSGTNGSSGTVDVKIQESDALATGYTDWTGGAFTQVTTDNDNAIQEKAYSGTKQYIRVVATVATATCDFGVSVIKNSPVSADEDYLGVCITTARQHAENVCNRALITQTWYGYLDRFPGRNFIEMPFAPLISVTAILYDESDDTPGAYGNTFSTDYYSVDTNTEPGRIVLNYGDSWESTTLATMNPIQIEFVCGYGAAASTVPSTIKSWIRAAAGYLYEHRDSPDLDRFPLGQLYNYRVYST